VIRSLLTVAFFVLIGPAISGLVLVAFAVVSILWRGLAGDRFTWIHLINPEVYLILLIGGYFIGLVPLAVSGSLVAWLRRKRPGQELVWVALIGLLVGFTYGLWLVPAVLNFKEIVLGPLANFSLAYMLSTICCWALVRRLDSRERNAA